MPPSNKRLIVCCDGTWNSPEQRHVTNVVRTARAVRPADDAGGPQIVYYDWGIGAFRGKLRGGMLGKGIDKNIQDAYRFLVHNYLPGDEVFLFGFSRGAYTARSLVGLIRNAGLLSKTRADLIPEAYGLYRHPTGPDAPSAVQFRASHSRRIRIAFIGVWDTVGALGIPSRIVRKLGDNRRYAFHDTSLSGIIDRARHAVAIDEQRIDFQPALWTRPPKPGQVIEQQWFAGVHGDVGGGNRDSGLSDTALEWIWSGAESAGLKFDESYRRETAQPNPLGKLHPSWTGMYRIKGRRRRPLGKLPPELEGIHPSVRQRYDDMPSYRPPNLVAYIENGGGWKEPA